jgi:hypothetical protein
LSETHPLVRSYDEREVALILKRAVDLQEGHGEGQQRLTLGDVQQIAREVGIDPLQVARAAETLERRSLVGDRSVLGAPTTLQTSVVLDREISDTELGEMLDLLRSTLGLQGTTSQGLDTIEWTGRDSVGGYSVTVSRRSGSTRLHLGTQRNEQAVVVVTLTGLAGMIGFGITAASLDPVSALGFWALLGGAGAATAGMSRLLWQRIARRWDGRLRDLALRLKSSLPAATAPSMLPTEAPAPTPFPNPAAVAAPPPL